MHPAPLLVLASTSRYRHELLQRLGLPFESHAPEVDETPVAGEAAPERARRLAAAKARAVAARWPEAVVIGSDQVASVEQGGGWEILRKPGTADRAQRQLAALSGRAACFDTAACVVAPGLTQAHVDRTRVDFRALSAADIARYIAREPAFDCAGGFKCEGLGVSLMQRLQTEDPTALIGLPLIWLCEALRRAGLSVP